MKPHHIWGGAALLTALIALAPGEATDTRYLTQANLPTNQQLSSLGLRKLWHGHVPTASAKDHVVKVQLFDDLLVAQTAGGGVIGLDAESGHVRWYQRFAGVMTGAGSSAGANRHHVLVVANNQLLALDRLSGTIDWSIYVPHLPTTSIVADETHAYYTAADGEVISFALPMTRKQLREVRDGTLQAEKAIDSPQWSWGMRLITALEHPPVLLNGRLIIPQRDGNVVLLQRDKAQIAERMPLFGALAAPIAVAENDLYIPSLDCSVSAVEMTPNGPVKRWRFSGDGRMMQKPLAAGADVFVVSEAGGLTCLDRQTGQTRWEQRNIKQTIAANQRALIALDVRDQLQAFDRLHGVHLGSWDAKNYRLPVTNDHNDRVYLANHDGLLLALRDVSLRHDAPKAHFPAKVNIPGAVDPVVTEAELFKRLDRSTNGQPAKANGSSTKMESIRNP